MNKPYTHFAVAGTRVKDEDEKISSAEVKVVLPLVKNGDHLELTGTLEKLRFTDEKAVETYIRRKKKKITFVNVFKAGTYPEHVAGNNWKLSTGETVTGKDEAKRLEPSITY